MAFTPTQLVHIGIKGTVLALDRATGAEVWRTPLEGSGFVNVILDGQDLFASANGQFFCLDPRDGRIVWKNKLKGMGFGLMTVAAGNSSMAGTAVAMAEYKRLQDEASQG